MNGNVLISYLNSVKLLIGQIKAVYMCAPYIVTTSLGAHRMQWTMFSCVCSASHTYSQTINFLLLASASTEYGGVGRWSGYVRL